MSIALLVNLIIGLIFLVVLVLVGRWAIRAMGLGDPWPTVLMLIVAAIAIVMLYHLFLGAGGLVHIGRAGLPMLPG